MKPALIDAWLVAAVCAGTAHAATIESAAPTLVKTFYPTSIVLGNISTLTITLGNPDAVPANLTADLTDNLPTPLVVANPNGASTNCLHGAVSANPGDAKVTLSDDGSGNKVQIPASSSCVVYVQVRSSATTAGTYTNQLPAGALQTDLGSNTGATSATLTVTSTAPTLAKTFYPTAIVLGNDSTLTITLTNTVAQPAVLNANLIDNLPADLSVANPTGAATNCAGGTVQATPGAGVVTLAAGAAIPANSACQVYVDVTADAGGVFANTIPAGALTTNLGANPAAANATLTVASLPPTLAKSFYPVTITPGNDSELTITLQNNDAKDATLSANFVDTFPGQLVVAGQGGASTNCDGGTASAAAGSNVVTLAGNAKIPANSSCTINVEVTANAPGTFTNKLGIGSLQTDVGINLFPTSAKLAVNPVPPTLNKQFTPTSVAADDTAMLTLTLTNSDAAPTALQLPLADNLPSGLVLASPALGATTCFGGSVTATPGQGTLSLAPAAQIPANASCTVTAAVTAKAAGSYTNTLPAAALWTSFGTNASAASANLDVTARPTPPTPPVLVATFAPGSVAPGASSRLSIGLYNGNGSAATLDAPLVATLPYGLTFANSPVAGTTCASGSVTVQGNDTLVLNGAAVVPARGGCSVAVNATGAGAGSYPLYLAPGALSTDLGGNAQSAQTTLVVAPPPDSIFANGFELPLQ